MHPTRLDLTTDGPIVLVEPGDDLDDLAQIGLSKDSGGLFGSRPEAVRRMSLPDGSIAYRVIQNDEYSPTVFLRSGLLAPEAERWLAAECNLTTETTPVTKQAKRLPDRNGQALILRGVNGALPRQDDTSKESLHRFPEDGQRRISAVPRAGD